VARPTCIIASVYIFTPRSRRTHLHLVSQGQNSTHVVPFFRSLIEELVLNARQICSPKTYSLLQYIHHDYGLKPLLPNVTATLCGLCNIALRTLLTILAVYVLASKKPSSFQLNNNACASLHLQSRCWLSVTLHHQSTQLNFHRQKKTIIERASFKRTMSWNWNAYRYVSCL
jgi:hypothetical protein